MIHTTETTRGWAFEFTCNKCGKREVVRQRRSPITIATVVRTKAMRVAHTRGWTINHAGMTHYCPNCATTTDPLDG